jgi:hypothetical protein
MKITNLKSVEADSIAIAGSSRNSVVKITNDIVQTTETHQKTAS